MSNRSVGINVLTSDNMLAQDAYEQFAELAAGLRPTFYDHVSVYSTDAGEEDEEYVPELALRHDENTLNKVRDALETIMPRERAQDSILVIQSAGILFRERATI